MENIYKKILDIRSEIASTKIKKDGKNQYSNYDYFTPELVNNLVEVPSLKHGVLNIFSIKKIDGVFVSHLRVIDVATREEMVFELPTAPPSIKETNETQQYGGMMTYAKRYSYMNAYNIQDNSLDFDSNDNSPKKTTVKSEPPSSIDAIENKLIDSLLRKIESTPTLKELESIYKNLSDDLKKNKLIKSCVIGKKNILEKI